MWLPWKAALWCALVLALIGVVVRPNGKWLRTVVDVSRQADNAPSAGQRGTHARSYGGASRAVVDDQFRRPGAGLPPLGDSTAQV